MNDYTIKIDEERQCVIFEGINFGHGVGCELPFWDYAERAGVVVVKKPGRTNWASMLHPSVYCPAEFMVLQVIPGSSAAPPRKGWLYVTEIVSFPVRKPKSE